MFTCRGILDVEAIPKIPRPRFVTFVTELLLVQCFGLWLLGMLFLPKYRALWLGKAKCQFLLPSCSSCICRLLALERHSKVSINTSISSPFVYLALGSLPLLSVQSGSTAALCLGELIASRFPEGLEEEAALLASMMAMLVGAMHFAMGIFDLAAVVELFSQPLLRARTGAAALVVMLAQAEVLFDVALTETLGSSL